jgi:protein required for attachment to host cells
MALSQVLPPSHELGNERLPRGHESVGPGRHAIEPKSDPHRRLKSSFAKHIADELEAAAVSKSFDRLIIVAPPGLLGDLRRELPRAVKDRAAAEIAKDLVAVPDHEIRKHLVDVVAF